jgi:hypothetical protein
MAIARRRISAEAPTEEFVQETAPEEAAPEPPFQSKAYFSPLLKTIVGYVFVQEKLWEGIFIEIREALELDSQGKAVDLPRMHHLTNRMLLTWRREMSRWSVENEVERASMRKAAIRTLNEEKSDGGKKTINKEDVEAQCALQFEDQYRAIRARETDIQLTEEFLVSAVRTFELKIRVRTA